MLKILPQSFLAIVLFSYASVTIAQKNQQPIYIIINDWSSQLVLANITGMIFQSVGYKVDYSFSTTNEQWGALAQGIDHVQVEVWQGTMAEMLARVVASGKVVEAGYHDAKTREEWWYPSYVEDFCPGLPDWRALKQCSSLFSSRGNQTGRYLAGPWEKPEAARIRALDLDFEVDTVKQADDLWQELETAKQNHQPIVLFNWSPNWVEAVYDGRFVEFPDYHRDCELDPAWGVNPEFHHDCGNPKQGWLKKAAWAGMPQQWPCAFEILQNINFDNQMISELAAGVDYHQLAYQQVAKNWIEDNQQLWQQWIPAHCQTERIE